MKKIAVFAQEIADNVSDLVVSQASVAYCSEVNIIDSHKKETIVEVKTITYSGAGEPELKIPVTEYEKRIPPECYVLTRLNLDKMEIAILGTITRHKFDLLKKKKQYGQSKPINYVVPLCVMDIL